MKNGLLKLTFYFGFVLVLFSGCAKERLNPVGADDGELFGDPVQPCSTTPVDVCTGNYFADMQTLFGIMGQTIPFQEMGRFDRMINCNLPYPVPCEHACEGSIVLEFGSGGLPQIDVFHYPEVPCSVADQTALRTHVLALANLHAPVCAANGLKYTPIAYDIYWQATVGIPGSFHLFAYVKYLPPCKGPSGGHT